MNVREHFQCVFTRIKYYAATSAILLSCLLTWRYPHLTRLQSAGAGLVSGIPFFAVLTLVLRRRFLCPRCGTNLARLQQQELRRERRARGWFNVQIRHFWDTWNACPTCSLGFNEPYS